MEENLQEKWVTEEACCLNCGYEWVAMHPDAKKLECTECGFMSQAENHSPPPVHIVISVVNGSLYIKPSRPIERIRTMGLLHETLGMLQASDYRIIRPKDCSINIVISHLEGEDE